MSCVRGRELVPTCRLGTGKLRSKRSEYSTKNEEEERKKGVLPPAGTSARCQPGEMSAGTGETQIMPRNGKGRLKGRHSRAKQDTLIRDHAYNKNLCIH